MIATNQEYPIPSEGTCMKSSGVQSVRPSLPNPSKLVVHDSTAVAVSSAVHRVDKTIAGGEVAGDQCAVNKV